MTNTAADSIADLSGEHIYIEDKLADDVFVPTQVRRRDRIKNLINGTVTELTIFDEGFIKVRQKTRQSSVNEVIVALAGVVRLRSQDGEARAPGAAGNTARGCKYERS